MALMPLRRRNNTTPDQSGDASKLAATSGYDELSPPKPLLAIPRRRVTRSLLSHAALAMCMTMVGWWAHQFFAPSPIFRADRVAEPPWWLEDPPDDFFSRTYMDGLRAVRKLNNSDFFTGMCGRYRFDEGLMPTVSVIVTLQNEQDGMLTLTTHSILARTPPDLLTEIIIIDDNGLGDIRGPVNDSELSELRTVSSKVRILTNTRREGVARSRMRGARAAKGDVLMFVDSHIEMLSGTWLQHLLVPIVENPNTVAAQTLDIISDLNWTYGTGSGDLLYGVINDEFWFSYQRSRFGGPDDKGMERESPGRRLPYETPFAAGSLFAVRRDTFMRLGGYDEGMYVWGGENTDFAIKIWSCGGRIVMVPCSRVGHMYRLHIEDTGGWPPDLPRELTDRLGLGGEGKYIANGYPADNFTKIILRNNIRVMERWAKNSNARTGYYLKTVGSETLPKDWQRFADEMKTDAFALQQERLIRHNGCRDFSWFDRHVYYKLTGVHHPWHPETPGRTWV